MESIREKLESLLRSLASDALEEDENTKRARHSSGQVMRLLLNAKRTEQGYRGAEVLVGPSRTEEAYVAAVLALKGEEMEREGDKKNDKMARASKAILFFELMRAHRTDEAARDAVHQAMKELGLYKEERFKGTDYIDGYNLTPLYELLRYFRPDFDDVSEKERIELLERTIGYANNYLKALRRLTAFLQYGKPGAYEGLPTKPVTQAAKQVRAAEFRELVGTERGAPLPYAKIGKLLGEKPTPGQMQPHLKRGYEARIRGWLRTGKAFSSRLSARKAIEPTWKKSEPNLSTGRHLAKTNRTQYKWKKTSDLPREMLTKS